jgi:alginate O-acetyltransferase complex protein AlgI
LLFNSLHFAFFLPLVFFGYWFLTKKNLKIQNILLLLASYYFYACWDWRFLFLLLFSTGLDYITGLKIAGSKNKNHRIIWFWMSVGVNLGFLGVFKYFDFFASSMASALSSINIEVHPWTLGLILPVGISFYTFHGLSYVIDIYQDKIEPEKNFIDYSLFVSFFPLLVAGPIERATHLLPQIKKNRIFDYSKAVDGLRQILWGLFKKVVIADNCAEIANQIFNNSSDYNGFTLAIGAVMFSVQIYGDFSGYSDIALGTARLFGIELLKNFSFPYFSRDIAEFWRRWHISLSSWFRDYLYIPLGGSKVGTWMKIRNTFVIFVVSGFWHGANWTFIFWGFLNALFILPSIIMNTNRSNMNIVAIDRTFPNLKELGSMVLTFSLATFAWIFFRAESITHAFQIIRELFSASLFQSPEIFPKVTFLLVIVFFVVEWIGRTGNYALQTIFSSRPFWWRWVLYIVLIFSVFFFTGKEQAFIYFQF